MLVTHFCDSHFKFGFITGIEGGMLVTMFCDSHQSKAIQMRNTGGYVSHFSIFNKNIFKKKYIYIYIKKYIISKKYNAKITN